MESNEMKIKRLEDDKGKLAHWLLTVLATMDSDTLPTMQSGIRQALDGMGIQSFNDITR